MRRQLLLVAARRQPVAVVRGKKAAAKAPQTKAMVPEPPMLGDAPWPYGYLQIMSDGSSMPMYYAAPLPGSPRKLWKVWKADIYTSPLYQRADKALVSNEDEEVVSAFRKKFGL